MEDDARLERRFRQLAVPAVLLVAFGMMHTGLGRMLSRIFLGMWVHEIGHAVAAWWSGYSAFPGPWRTSVSDGRVVVVSLLLAAALAGGGAWAWRRTERPVWPAVLGGLLLLQLYLTLGVSATSARTLITFFGDGGQMVLGTLLMATFWVRPGSHLHTTWLRWGFLVIGAFAYMDAFVTWSQAAADPDTIPFGEMEGVGTSDPTRLVDDYGWSIEKMVSRFGMLRWGCLAALAAVYVWGLVKKPPEDPGVVED